MCIIFILLPKCEEDLSCGICFTMAWLLVPPNPKLLMQANRSCFSFAGQSVTAFETAMMNRKNLSLDSALQNGEMGQTNHGSSSIRS